MAINAKAKPGQERDPPAALSLRGSGGFEVGEHNCRVVSNPECNLIAEEPACITKFQKNGVLSNFNFLWLERRDQVNGMVRRLPDSGAGL